jgi:putative flavoprotein involved in K+ transport
LSTEHRVAVENDPKEAASWLSRSLGRLRRVAGRQRRPSGPSRTKIVERTATRTPCLIIGAGHNGLSVAVALRKRGIEPILLEQHERIGDQWRERYERLHLHHITDAMHLPGVPYPAHLPRYLSRLDMADYMEAYARLQGLDVRCEHKVTHLGRNAAGEWEAEVERAGDPAPLRFTADHVVLAAGSTGVTPRIPVLEGREEWAGQVLHSQQYWNAEEFKGKRVLLVGAGNSGIEICCDLYDNGAFPSMLIRAGNSWVTREAYAKYHRLLQFGGPIAKYVPFTWLLAPFLVLGMDAFFKYDVKRRYGDLSSKGVRVLPATPMLEMAKSQGTRAPTYVDGTWGDVGVSIFELIRDGKVPTFTAEISHLEPGTKTVVFRDGQRAGFDAVLLCTGFDPILSHYATFVDESIVDELGQEGVFRFLEPMKEFPGLWASLGGIVGSRYGQDTLGAQIAARIQGRPAPFGILPPALAFFFCGIDPITFQVPKSTIVINAIATLWLLAAML